MDHLELENSTVKKMSKRPGDPIEELSSKKIRPLLHDDCNVPSEDHHDVDDDEVKSDKEGLILVKFYVGYYRHGDLEGLFITTKSKLESAMGTKVYLGDVLGKHSDVSKKLKKEHFTTLSDDHEKIRWLLSVNGGEKTISGRNPLEQLEESDDDDDDNDGDEKHHSH
jgi:hypothetical protein